MPIVADKDNNPESIMISAWPVYDEKLHFAAEQTDFTKVVDAIRAIRVQRNELNVPPSKKVTMYRNSRNGTVRGRKGILRASCRRRRADCIRKGRNKRRYGNNRYRKRKSIYAYGRAC